MKINDTEKHFLIITVDGAAATGKSSTAKSLAQKLNFLHIDTGKHFRALTYYFLSEKIEPINNEVLKTSLARLITSTCIREYSAYLKINNKDIAEKDLRTFEINKYVSKYASIKPLRDFLLTYQRSLKTFAKENNFTGIVIEGRDIGSIVFPSAQIKVFLHADETTRIIRRQNEGQKDFIKKRDSIDQNRKVAPLVCPKDAISINTTNHSIEEVVNLIIKKI